MSQIGNPLGMSIQRSVPLPQNPARTWPSLPHQESAARNITAPSCELTSPPEGLSFDVLPRWIREGKRELHKESRHSSNRSPRNRAPCARQGARCVQRGPRPAAHRRQRPPLRIRLHPSHRNSRQRAGAHPTLHLLVRLFARRHADPLPDGERRPVPGGAAPVPRSAGGPLHAGETRQDDRNRVRGAWLPLGIGLERISRPGHGLRHPTARRFARERQTARTHLYARHQGVIGTRRKRQLRRRGFADRRDPRQTPARSHPGDLLARRALRRNQGHPDRGHQVRVRLRGRSTGAGRRSPDARFLALLAGGILPARRSAVELRQAVCARLSGIHPLEQAAAGAAAARRGGGEDGWKVSPGLPDPDRPRVMNWLDIVLALILAVSIAAGFHRGLSRQIIGLVSVVLALLLGIWFYGNVGYYLLPYASSRTLANAGGFALVFCGVLVLGALVSFVVGKFLKVTGLSIVDHVLGAGFGLLRGWVFAIAIIMGVMAFSRGDKPPEAIVNSRMAPYVVDAARMFAAMAPHDLKEGFRRTYAQVKVAWSAALEKGIRQLPNGGEEMKDSFDLLVGR